MGLSVERERQLRNVPRSKQTTIPPNWRAGPEKDSMDLFAEQLTHSPQHSDEIASLLRPHVSIRIQLLNKPDTPLSALPSW